MSGPERYDKPGFVGVPPNSKPAARARLHRELETPSVERRTRNVAALSRGDGTP